MTTAPDKNEDGIPDYRNDDVDEVGIDLGIDGVDYRAKVVESDDPNFDYAAVPKKKRSRPKPVAYRAGISFEMPSATKSWTFGKVMIVLLLVLMTGPLGYWLGYSPSVVPEVKPDPVRVEVQRSKDAAESGKRDWWLAVPASGRKKLDDALEDE